MVGKAQSTMRYILHSGDYSYEVIRRKLIDHFHGDETRETSLKKFMKMKRKPGEKIYDFAIRLKERFKYAYPKEHGDETFEVILKEKFIDGLDEKLQMKVKYKQYENFDDLVAAARKYSTRIEGLNSDTRDKHDFINAIHHVNMPPNVEIVEIKNAIEKQIESVNAIATAMKQGMQDNVSALKNGMQENASGQNELASQMQEITKAVSFLLAKDVKRHMQKKEQNNSSGIPFSPFVYKSDEQNQQYFNKCSQPSSSLRRQQSHLTDFNQQPRGTWQFDRDPISCYYCGEKGHTQNTCYALRRQKICTVQTRFCCLCRMVGHKSYQCPQQLEFSGTDTLVSLSP